MTAPTPAAVARALAAHAPVEIPALPGRTNHERAGVLVPLAWDPDPVCVLELRSARLRRHAGEVSFPGGRRDPGDPDLWATATREAREELGIDRARPLGRLSSTPLYTSDFRLEPFVAEVPAGSWRPDGVEVAVALTLKLSDVLRGPTIEALPYVLHGATHLSPVFPVGDAVMFGATAHVFLELLTVIAPLYGRALPPLRVGGRRWDELLR